MGAPVTVERLRAIEAEQAEHRAAARRHRRRARALAVEAARLRRELAGIGIRVTVHGAATEDRHGRQHHPPAS